MNIENSMMRRSWICMNMFCDELDVCYDILDMLLKPRQPYTMTINILLNRERHLPQFHDVPNIHKWRRREKMLKWKITMQKLFKCKHCWYLNFFFCLFKWNFIYIVSIGKTTAHRHSAARCSLGIAVSIQKNANFFLTFFKMWGVGTWIEINLEKSPHCDLLKSTSLASCFLNTTFFLNTIL